MSGSNGTENSLKFIFPLVHRTLPSRLVVCRGNHVSNQTEETLDVEIGPLLRGSEANNHQPLGRNDHYALAEKPRGEKRIRGHSASAFATTTTALVWRNGGRSAGSAKADQQATGHPLQFIDRDRMTRIAGIAPRISLFLPRLLAWAKRTLCASGHLHDHRCEGSGAGRRC